jgi:hypothetical protein
MFTKDTINESDVVATTTVSVETNSETGELTFLEKRYATTPSTITTKQDVKMILCGLVMLILLMSYLLPLHKLNHTINIEGIIDLYFVKKI